MRCRYEEVWARRYKKAGRTLHVWRPVPPSANFVALGHVVTTDGQPPPLGGGDDAAAGLRVVHRALLSDDHFARKALWAEREGKAGAAGALWGWRGARSAGFPTAFRAARTASGGNPPAVSHHLRVRSCAAVRWNREILLDFSDPYVWGLHQTPKKVPWDRTELHSMPHADPACIVFAKTHEAARARGAAATR